MVIPGSGLGVGTCLRPSCSELVGEAQCGPRDPPRRPLCPLAGGLALRRRFGEEGKANGRLATCWWVGSRSGRCGGPGFQPPPGSPSQPRPRGGGTAGAVQGDGRGGAGGRGRWALLRGLGLTAVTPKGWGFSKKDKFGRQSPPAAQDKAALGSAPDAVSAERGHRAGPRAGGRSSARRGRVSPAGRALCAPGPWAGAEAGRAGAAPPNFGRGRHGDRAPARPAPPRAPGLPARGPRAAAARSPDAAAPPPRRPRALAGSRAPEAPLARQAGGPTPRGLERGARRGRGVGFAARAGLGGASLEPRAVVARPAMGWRAEGAGPRGCSRP